MNKERILIIAKALREAPQPISVAFDMRDTHDTACGTPMCAFGHFAAREDLQDFARIELREDDDGDGWYSLTKGPWDNATLNYFEISYSEADALFNSDGCGGAKTTIEAAEYIEAFVANAK